MRVCIVTPAKLELTETFIRAHIASLPHEIVHLYGPRSNPVSEEVKVREWHASSIGKRRRWLNLLPRFVEFRVRRALSPEPSIDQILADFMRYHSIDVVLAEYGTTAAWIAPSCASAKVPLVAHFHGFDASKHELVGDKARGYAVLFRTAHAIVTPSRHMADRLSELGCPKSRIRCNPYGPAPGFLNICPDYNSNKLIAVGRFTEKKAPYLTLDAFRQALSTHPDLTLDFIGDGELFEVVARLVGAWQLDGRVKLVGKADHEAVMKAMAEAFAFLQHSVSAFDGDQEGIPVAILEAGAAALPVIATRHAGIVEVVEEGETGYLVDENDTEAMAQCIVLLAENRSEARRLGTKARERVKTQLSMERHLRELNRVLVEAASGNMP